MHEIGHQLGLMHAYDLPAHTLLGQDAVGQSQYGPALLENDFPGDHDEVHLNHLHRPESRDIDLYEFTLSEAGLFTAETMAERLRDFNESNEVLNSALMLFRQNADGSHEVVAQNDDYFSDDSYLEVTLDPGTYFVGVSSTGNTAYDPTIPDSGFYGTSAGEYQLKMNFRPDVDVASGNVWWMLIIRLTRIDLKLLRPPSMEMLMVCTVASLISGSALQLRQMGLIRQVRRADSLRRQKLRLTAVTVRWVHHLTTSVRH